jgi:hypothetical protein
MYMGLMGLGHKQELYRIVIYMIEAEVGETVGGIGVMATVGLLSSCMQELTKQYTKRAARPGIPKSGDFRLPNF